MAWKSDSHLYDEEPPLPPFLWNEDHSLPENTYILEYSFEHYTKPGTITVVVNGVTLPFSMHSIARFEQPQFAYGKGQDVDHLRCLAHSILAWEFTGQFGREAAEDYASMLMDRFIDKFLLDVWTKPPKLGTHGKNFWIGRGIFSDLIFEWIQQECMDLWDYEKSIHKIGSWIDLDGLLPWDGRS